MAEAAAGALILGRDAFHWSFFFLAVRPDFIAQERDTFADHFNVSSLDRGEMLTARGRSKAMPMIKMPGFGATPPVCLWAFFAIEIEHPCLCTIKS